MSASVCVHVRTPLVPLCGPIGEQTVQTQPVRISLLVYSVHSQHIQLTRCLSSLLPSLLHSVYKLHVILPEVTPQHKKKETRQKAQISGRSVAPGHRIVCSGKTSKYLLTEYFCMIKLKHTTQTDYFLEISRY